MTLQPTTRTLAASLAAVLCAAALPAAAGRGHEHGASLEDCLMAASAIRAGEFVKVEYLIVSPIGEPTYEIEIRDADNREWEFMCSAASGNIYEIETEVASSENPSFGGQAKVSEQRAREIATDRFAGDIQEIEYELEANGSPTYEIDIVDEQGTEFKVEVDAITGDIIEVSVEHWEIGVEKAERVEPPSS